MEYNAKTVITVDPKTGNRFEELRKKWAEQGEGDDRSDADRFLTYLMDVTQEDPHAGLPLQ